MFIRERMHEQTHDRTHAHTKQYYSITSAALTHDNHDIVIIIIKYILRTVVT